MGVEYHNEVDRLYKGMRYIVRLWDWGYRCGYVQVSEEQFKRAEEVELSCHGGITFSGEVKEETNIHLPEGYWLGFDCNHIGDGADEEAVARLIGNTKYLPDLKQADTLAVTSEEAEKDCKSLIDQILNMEDKDA